MVSTESTERRLFPVLQMSCAACALSVEDILRKQPGVLQAEVNYAGQTARVEYDPRQVSPEQLREAVQDMGYDLITVADQKGEEEAETIRNREFQTLTRHTFSALALAVPVFFLGMFWMHWQPGWYISWILSTPVIAWFGRRFFVHAWLQARVGSANMDTLVALSTGTAYLFSVLALVRPQLFPVFQGHPPLYFEASTVVISFILLGKWLEERAKRKTGSAIRKLMGLQVNSVLRVHDDGHTEEMPVEMILPGDLLLARAGERFATDGEVVSGESYVDESTMTGEPLPVSKSAGLPVLAGTINGEGTLQYVAQKTGQDTLLARIIQTVREAQGSKPPVQKLADAVSRIFVPSVLVIAILTWLAWGWLGGPEGWKHGLHAFLTVLVVACPCALGLATPTALMAGMGKAASMGILIQDASSLELARNARAILLDKTGTLTLGKPALIDSIVAEAETGNLFSQLESYSTHPLAKAAVESLGLQGSTTLQQVETLPGKGIQGVREGMLHRAGQQDWLESFGITFPDTWQQQAQAWAKQGHSLVWYSQGLEPKGIFAFSDTLRPDAPRVVQELQAMGLEVHILSGDHPAAVQSVAETCGIQHYQGNLLPEDKAAYIRKLESAGTPCIMVGDGINDSTALATASVSMAMGSGSDIALESAQITLLNGDITKIAEAIALSRRTMQTIRQNLFWAFAYNVLAIPVAAGVLYPFTGYQPDPMLAGAAMALSSITVVGNSLRRA